MEPFCVVWGAFPLKRSLYLHHSDANQEEAENVVPNKLSPHTNTLTLPTPAGWYPFSLPTLMLGKFNNDTKNNPPELRFARSSEKGHSSSLRGPNQRDFFLLQVDEDEVASFF